MKNITFVLSVFLGLAGKINAQAIKNDTIKEFKKNEIGMILNPVGIVLLGAQPTGQRMGVLVKRSLKSSNVYFTTGAYYQGFTNQINKDNQLTLEVSGTLRNIQYRIETSNKAFLSFGAEKRWAISQCPSIVTYLGFEYLISYGAEYANTGSQWMKADTLQGVELDVPNMQAVSDFNQTNKVTKNTYGFGVQFNAGVQMHLNKRLYLFAQTAPSMLLSTGRRKETNVLNQTTNTYQSSQFDFDMRSLVSDVGLFYKF
jgi:hypothetical protein